MLDNQGSYMYIIDPETMKVLYSNSLCQKVIGADPAGWPCYRAMMRRRAPCEKCPVALLKQEGKTRPMELFNPSYNLWFLCEASHLSWNGRPAILVNSLDVTRYRDENDCIKTEKNARRALRGTIQDTRTEHRRDSLRRRSGGPEGQRQQEF